MAGKVRFGMGLPVVNLHPNKLLDWEGSAGPTEVARVAAQADKSGFYYISCTDHVAIPKSRSQVMGTQWHDPIATLSYVAALTTNVRLLTGVLVLPYRHVLVTAKAFATVDWFSKGRLILGVGCGHLKPEFNILGAPFEPRGPVTDEYIQALRIIWSRDDPRFKGKYVDFHDVIVLPKPVQKPSPPIWVGGNTGAALRRAACLGDGWVPWQLTMEELDSKVKKAQEIRAEMGLNGHFDVVGPTGAVDLLSKTQRGGAVAWGSPSNLAEYYSRWLEAGATVVQVNFVAGSCNELLEQIQAFGETVIPMFV